MKETKIKLSNVQDIRDFVNVVILADYDVDLVQGRYVVDAKSIMGIFSLDLLSPITLVAHSENADGLIERVSNDDDQRYLKVSITSKGYELYNENNLYRL